VHFTEGLASEANAVKIRLTAAAIEKLSPPPSGRLDVFDEYLPGFAVRITPNGHRSFIARARIKGQKTPLTVTIGSTKEITLLEARARASEALRQMRDGDDPRPKTVKPAATLTFDALIAEWATLHLAHRRPRYAVETPATIRKGLPDLLARPAGEITRADAVNAIDKLVTVKPGAARNVLAYARSCFEWALLRGKVPANPFARLPVAAVAKQRERVLSDDEMADLWAATDALGYPFGPFYKLLILTLQRREMVAAMRWSEIEGDTWRIPGPRMKMGKPHDVHLSAPTRTILAGIPRVDDSDFVFTTTGETPISGFSKAKQLFDAAIWTVREANGRGAMPQWTPHDFRRTGVSKLAELGFDSIVADKLLAHKPAKLQGAAAIYQRYEFLRERATALDAWAAHVTGLGTGDNILPLRRGAAARAAE
jgi:integrase